MDKAFQLSDEEHKLKYAEIEKDSFAGTTPVERPRIVITGGQPGSGKSKLIELSKDEFPDGNVVVINGDDLRYYHPKANQILKIDDKRFAERTDPDSRKWTRQLFDKAIVEQRNIIFESTMREADPLSKTMMRLKESGYQITAKVVACHERMSATGVFMRYESQKADKGYGRFSAMESHDAGYDGMPKTIDYIEKNKLADNIQVHDRSGRVLYSNKLEGSKWKNDPRAAQIVEAERSRQPTNIEIQQFQETWKRITTLMEKRQATLRDFDQARETYNKYSRQLERGQNKQSHPSQFRDAAERKQPSSRTEMRTETAEEMELPRDVQPEIDTSESLEQEQDYVEEPDRPHHTDKFEARRIYFSESDDYDRAVQEEIELLKAHAETRAGARLEKATAILRETDYRGDREAAATILTRTSTDFISVKDAPEASGDVAGTTIFKDQYGLLELRVLKERVVGSEMLSKPDEAKLDGWIKASETILLEEINGRLIEHDAKTCEPNQFVQQNYERISEVRLRAGIKQINNRSSLEALNEIEKLHRSGELSLSAEKENWLASRIELKLIDRHQSIEVDYHYTNDGRNEVLYKDEMNVLTVKQVLLAYEHERELVQIEFGDCDERPGPVLSDSDFANACDWFREMVDESIVLAQVAKEIAQHEYEQLKETPSKLFELEHLELNNRDMYLKSEMQEIDPAINFITVDNKSAVILDRTSSLEELNHWKTLSKGGSLQLSDRAIYLLDSLENAKITQLLAADCDITTSPQLDIVRAVSQDMDLEPGM